MNILLKQLLVLSIYEGKHAESVETVTQETWNDIVSLR